MDVGDLVEFQRGDGWLIGRVVLIKRNTRAHIEVGDDFTGRRVYREKVANCRRPK